MNAQVCYGLFWRMTSPGQVPKPSKLLGDKVYWTVEDANHARFTMDSPEQIDIYEMTVTVEP